MSIWLPYSVVDGKSETWMQPSVCEVGPMNGWPIYPQLFILCNYQYQPNIRCQSG